MFIIRGNGMDLFASSSVLECFEYMKNAPDIMPKGYKSLQLILPDWFKHPVIVTKAAPSSLSSNEIHIHIHIGE